MLDQHPKPGSNFVLFRVSYIGLHVCTEKSHARTKLLSKTSTKKTVLYPRVVNSLLADYNP